METTTPEGKLPEKIEEKASTPVQQNRCRKSAWDRGMDILRIAWLVDKARQVVELIEHAPIHW